MSTMASICRHFWSLWGTEKSCTVTTVSHIEVANSAVCMIHSWPLTIFIPWTIFSFSFFRNFLFLRPMKVYFYIISYPQSDYNIHKTYRHKTAAEKALFYVRYSAWLRTANCHTSSCHFSFLNLLLFYMVISLFYFFNDCKHFLWFLLCQWLYGTAVASTNNSTVLQ